MNKGKTIFSQIMSLIPERDFKACVDRYKGNYRARNFSCKDQFLVMSYAQLTDRDSLRDIENCLSALSNKLYHCGISYAVPRNTLAKANEKRDWHIYKDFADTLLKKVRPLYAMDNFRLDLDNMVYAFDSSTISLCLKLCPWAKFRTNKGGIKNAKVDKSTGVISDENIKLTGQRTSKWYPEEIRMVTYEDYATNNVYRFLTNNMEYEALTISELYRERWNVELFFKWIKQHLHIKSFYGTSENAIYMQIWIAICTYLLLAYAKKVMHIDQSLHTISKNVGLFLTDKTTLNELFNKTVPKENCDDSLYPSLFNYDDF